jgi:primosomal replication protein N
MKNPTLFHEAHRATYCPEDDKLRLYVGRVPREEYQALKAEGWTSTPKQDCDFAAVWSVRRKNTAESYAGIIEDEDAGPDERAADRAERFSGYLDRRLNEATGHADRYDSGPSAHGYQSAARAERAASRHDRSASRAVDAWDKAEYWQHRTAGVIANALHRSSPAVRMGRIKTIEADLRKAEKSAAQYAATFAQWSAVAAESDPAAAYRLAYDLANSAGAGYRFHHPREASRTRHDAEHGTSIYSLMTQANDPITGHEAAAVWLAGRIDPAGPEIANQSQQQFIRHCQLRLAYEFQMLEAQGGRAALLEMEIGGWIGGHQIRKINKSPATGRVVSVQIMAQVLKYDRTSGTETQVSRLKNLNIERLAESSYRAPTAEDKAALAATLAAEKSAHPKTATIPLINPTLEDAQRLQALINNRYAAEWERRHGKPSSVHFPEAAEVCQITQADYSAVSGGAYAKAETRGLCADAALEDGASSLWTSSAAARAKARGPACCKIRVTGYGPERVIYLTDKPSKPLPAACWLPRETVASAATPETLPSLASI